MGLLEYQAKGLLASAGIAVPAGRVATTVTEAVAAAQQVGLPVAVKAQVPTGGRGKAGGIALARSVSEVEAAAQRILRLSIGGFPVQALLIERAWAGEISDATRQLEWYAAVTLDRHEQSLVALFSTAGGVDVEVVSRQTPWRMLRLPVAATGSWWPFQGRELVARAKIETCWTQPLNRLFAAMVNLAYREDALLVEINPLFPAPSGELWALDAKIERDEAAFFRHDQPPGAVTPPLDWTTLAREVSRLPEAQVAAVLENRARQAGLAYVRLTGDIGIIGNGAGLVMATVDAVQRLGGRPADFLDVGGGARRERVQDALQLVAADPQVRVILVNVLGGITRADEVAAGILAATGTLAERGRRLPLVVRLAGNRSEEGRALLSRSVTGAGGPIHVASSLTQAVQLAIETA
ncbi:MAG: acetate--CoA ligase family protein [Limnochordaceae bacterium]|nr:acetate--CoA ligase family protein [Limnochordaceae bacterium]